VRQLKTRVIAQSRLKPADRLACPYEVAAHIQQGMELIRLIERRRSAMPDLRAADKHPGRSLESALPRLRRAPLIDDRQPRDTDPLLEIDLDLRVRRRLGPLKKPVE
jgi:hypothetical protein